MKKIKILFVCLGNICRSPLAAAIMKDKIRKQGLETWLEVDSCGTSNYHIGSGADERTVASAAVNGVPIDHCARQLSKEDLERFDFIFAMDRSNYENILRFTGAAHAREKVKMMREFDTSEKGADVPDPYHGGESEFTQVYRILDRCTSNFLEFLKKEYPERIT